MSVSEALSPVSPSKPQSVFLSQSSNNELTLKFVGIIRWHFLFLGNPFNANNTYNGPGRTLAPLINEYGTITIGFVGNAKYG